MITEQQELDNKLINSIRTGKSEQTYKLLNDGASPLAHECMAIQEAVNHDRLDVLKVILSNEKTMQHVKDNPDVFFFSFLDEQGEKLNCLKYLANETDINLESMYDKNNLIHKQGLEFINKTRLHYRMSQKPQKPKIKSKSYSMKI